MKMAEWLLLKLSPFTLKVRVLVMPSHIFKRDEEYLMLAFFSFFYPITLRTAKTHWSSGCSERNRVKNGCSDIQTLDVLSASGLVSWLPCYLSTRELQIRGVF